MKTLLSLLIATLLAACVDNPVDPTDRYQGPVEPCDVVVDGSHRDYEGIGFDKDRLDPFSSDVPRFWEPGPFPVWNTTPDPQCGADPIIDYVGEETVTRNDEPVEVTHKDVKMYITYPSRSVPTKTGDGRVAEGRYPIVIFAHANHDRQCDIYQGYFSLHDHWASWGFVVVAIDGTQTNCKRGSRSNVEIRSAGQVAAIDRLKELDADPESRFHERLDFDRIVFAGHSRGGGAAFISKRDYPEALGVIDIQGVDLTAFGFGSAMLPDYPVIGLTAGVDVDLNYPLVEPMEDQVGGEYTWVNINGGIHAYTGDSSPLEHDDEPLIGRQQQHDVTEYYTTAFLARLVGVPRTFGGDIEFIPQADQVLFSHYGTETVDDEISKLGAYTRWNERLENAIWVDDFNSPIRGNEESENLLGGENVSTGFTKSKEVATYKPDTSPVSGMWGKSYSRQLIAEADSTFTTFLTADQSPMVIAAGTNLVSRVKGPDTGSAAKFDVVLVTTDGDKRVDGTQFIGPEELANRFTQLVIPLAEFGDGDCDVTAVRFDVEPGTLFLDDLRFETP